MRNRWNADEAAAHEGPLAQCVYATRLLGADRTVVAHGGGNTSVKVRRTDLFGDPLDVLHVKGSGWDLDAIEPEGFTALDLARVRRLADLDDLPDTVMLGELLQARLDPAAPSPSVETIIHALLPAAAVMHTHPNSLLAMSNTDGGEQRVRELYGGSVIVVPYAMPGFRLGGKMVAGYAGFARNCGFYPHSGNIIPQFADEIAALRFRHRPGAISFTPARPLPEDLVRRLVAARLAELGLA